MLKKREHERRQFSLDDTVCFSLCEAGMGLAPGGLMRQQLYEDRYGFDAWDTTVSSRCFVHILNSLQWQQATGKVPPGRPPTAQTYGAAGLPWFDYYDDTQTALSGADKLAQLDSVGAKSIKNGNGPLPDNEPIAPKTVVALGKKGQVKQGDW